MNPKFFFILIFFYFVRISFCSPSSYEWDSSNLINNLHTFAQFLDSIYSEYLENDKMDLIFIKEKYHPKRPYDDKQQRAVFNFTFVKWAAELAHFRVNNGDKAYQQNLYMKISENYNKFYGFVHYDETLGHQISEKFTKKVFAPKNPINKKVVNQILMLTISFSIRILLCVIYADYFNEHLGVGRWQLKSLLLAYKKISDNNNMESHGIFPFKIISTDKKGANNFWAQKLTPRQKGMEENNISEEQQQFIDNFKFIIELSEYELTYLQIFEIIHAIMRKIKEKNSIKTNIKNPFESTKKYVQSPRIYSIIEKKALETLSAEPMPLPKPIMVVPKSKLEKWGFRKTPKSSIKDKEIPESPIIKSNWSQIDCALIIFGRQLLDRFNLKHKEFNMIESETKSQEMCGINATIKSNENYKINGDNTPSEGSEQLTMKLFKEPLWNYMQVIGFKAKSCQEVLDYCSAIRGTSIVVKKMEKIEEMTESEAFKSLISMHYDYAKAGKEFQKKPIADKVAKIKEFFNKLDGIRDHYSRTVDGPLNIFNLVEHFNSKAADKEEEVERIFSTLKESVEFSLSEIKVLQELHEFTNLKNCIRQFEYKKNIEELNALAKDNDDTIFEVLDQIERDYSQADPLICSGRINFQIINLQPADVSFEFGEILYETLKKYYPHEVKYDEKQQYRTFPLSIAEQIFHRLNVFVERNLTKVHIMKNDIDFLKTIQSAVAPGEVVIKSEWRQNLIDRDVNVALFELLFSWAIRLCMQMEQNEEFVEKYFPSFLFGFKLSNRCNCFPSFEHKMKVENEIVKLNVPYWNLPYDLNLNNEKEIKKEKPQKNLSENSLVQKMANIPYKMTADYSFEVRPSSPNVLLFLLNFLDGQKEAITGQRKLEVEGHYGILAQFVKDLLEKAKHLPKKRILEIFDRIQLDHSIIESLFCSGKINFQRFNSPSDQIFNFGKILYEFLKMHYPDEVKYDEKQQLLTFPLTIAKQFFHRISIFFERNLNAKSQIEDDIDFLKTIHSAFTPEGIVKQFVWHENFIFRAVNLALFKLLLSWAIRLCMQIEHNDEMVAKYFQSFLFGLKMSNGWNQLPIFEYKMKVENEIVNMNLPNWNLPDDLHSNQGIRYETIEQFKADFDISKVVNLNINKDEQIISLNEMVFELEEMMAKNCYNYSNFYYRKMFEWEMLKLAFSKSGKSEKWEEIQKLCEKWHKEYEESFPKRMDEPKDEELLEKPKEKQNLKNSLGKQENKNEGEKLKKTMKKLKEKMENLKEAIKKQKKMEEKTFKAKKPAKEREKMRKK